MQDSNPEGLWNRIPSRLNARWQTDWAIEDQAKYLNSTARPYDQRVFSPLDPTAVWHSHLALAIYVFVVVNFDALAQASDFRIERDKLSSSAECRIRTQMVSETESPADRMPADKPTELSRIKLKNLNLTACPYDQRAFSPLDPTANWLSHLALAIYMFVVVNFLCSGTGKRFSNRKEAICLPLLNAGCEPKVSDRHQIVSILNVRWQTHWAVEDQAKKTWTGRPVPMISEHSAHSKMGV